MTLDSWDPLDEFGQKINKQQDGIVISESDAIQHVNDKYEEMVRNAQAAGREIPRVPIYPETIGAALAANVDVSERVSAYRDGIEIARMSVSASQDRTRAASRRSFTVPHMPWKDRRVTKLAERIVDAQ